MITADETAGDLVRTWRRRRGFSQMDVALAAGISCRHLSFIETGRSRPSRGMVLRLAEHLDVPLRARNAMLAAAGFTPAYAERSFDAPELGSVRAAVDRFLRAHDPYPAIACDRRFNLVTANDAVDAFREGIAAELWVEPVCLPRLTLHPAGLAPRIINFDQWSASVLARIRRQAVATADAVLAALLDELASYPGVTTTAPSVPDEVLLPLRLRDGDGELAFFNTVQTFGTAADVWVTELSIEAFYPADARTANRLLSGVAA